MPDCMTIIAMLATFYSLSPGEVMHELQGLDRSRQDAVLAAIVELRNGDNMRACEIIQELDDP